MVEPTYVVYACTRETFRPSALYPVRWLEPDRDYELAQAFWPTAVPLSREAWTEAYQLGYQYGALIEREHILSLAAVWRNAPTTWEVAAVRTHPAARRLGYAKTIVSFVTQHILAAGKMATCTTDAGNLAMQRTAESVGFYRVR
jgi:hypothetical protein